MTHRVFCSFNDVEYAEIEKQAEKAGLSISRFTEYAALLHVNMPRKAEMSLQEIQRCIASFLDSFDGESFYCNTPFGNRWAQMTTSDKRTAASQLKKFREDGVIEKVEPTSKSHQAARYRKIHGREVQIDGYQT